MRFESVNVYTNTLIFIAFFFLNLPVLKNTKNKNEAKEQEKRDYFFDVLRGISAIGVILIHLIRWYLNVYELPTVFVYLSNILRFSVPFFFIISGYLCTLKNYSGKEVFSFYSRKFVRLFIPYTIFFIFCNYITRHYLFYGFEHPILTFFTGVSTPEYTTQYYFLIILFQLYIIYPLLLWITKKVKNHKTLLITIFILSFISMIRFQVFGSYYYFFLPYTFYFMFGMLLKQHKDDIDLKKFISSKTSTIVYIITIAIFLVFAIIGREEYGNFNFGFVLSLFLLFYSHREKFENKFKFLNSLGRNSYYIYLVHPTIFNLVYGKACINIETQPLNFIVYTILSIIFGVFCPYLLFVIIHFIKNKIKLLFNKNNVKKIS